MRRELKAKKLSNREAEVSELVALGFANKEVASKLFVTEKTVKFHLTNIYKKLAVKSRTQLIVLFSTMNTELQTEVEVPSPFDPGPSILYSGTGNA